MLFLYYLAISKLKRQVMSHLSKAMSIALMISITSTAIAHDIVPDNHAAQHNKPVIVNQAGHKAPIIQIAPPDKHGISHNKYESFSTNNGAIFSNNKPIVNHPLDAHAPKIQANPNLSKGTAKIIINEVTGKKASRLGGHFSVAGDHADVIFSNPNGIKLNGITISNSNHVVITTGKLKFNAQQKLQGYDVTQGTISIDGKGTNFANTDRVDLLARGIEINSKVWGKKSINIITGNNEISHDTLHIKARKNTEKAPEVAIDIAALGGMYADKIHLVGTEKGLGVKTDKAHDILADSGFMLDFRQQLNIRPKDKDKHATQAVENNKIDNTQKKHGIVQLNDNTDRLYLSDELHYVDLQYPEAKEQIHGGYLNNGKQGGIIFTPDLSLHSGMPISANDIQAGPAYAPTKPTNYIPISPDIPGAPSGIDSPLKSDGVIPATLAKPVVPVVKPVLPEDVVPKITDDNNQSSSNGGVFGHIIIGAGTTAIGGGVLGTNILTKPGLTPTTPTGPTTAVSGSTAPTASGHGLNPIVAGGAAVAGSSWASIASKPATSTAPANPYPNTSISFQKPGTSYGYTGQNWTLDPTKQKNTYWNAYSENHVFQGDKNGGGHLYGSTDPTKSKFPKGWTTTQIKDIVDTVINNPKTTWRPSVNGNKTVTTVFNVDKQTVKVVLDPKSLNVITTYPVGNIPKAPAYQFSNTFSNQIPGLNRPPASNNISNDLSPMGR